MKEIKEYNFIDWKKLYNFIDWKKLLNKDKVLVWNKDYQIWKLHNKQIKYNQILFLKTWSSSKDLYYQNILIFNRKVSWSSTGLWHSFNTTLCLKSSRHQSLLLSSSKLAFERALVRTSTIWSLVLQYSRVISTSFLTSFKKYNFDFKVLSFAMKNRIICNKNYSFIVNINLCWLKLIHMQIYKYFSYPNYLIYDNVSCCIFSFSCALSNNVLLSWTPREHAWSEAKTIAWSAFHIIHRSCPSHCHNSHEA